MQWIKVPGWILGAVFVLLLFSAYALWPSYRIIGVANLVFDGIILVYSVISGYRSPPEAHLTRNPEKAPESRNAGN